MPAPHGIIIIQGTPYVCFDYVDNAISLAGFDSSYGDIERFYSSLGSIERLQGLLAKNQKETYFMLGGYVNRLFNNGVYNTDMAKRNFMAKFTDSGELASVFAVDFEKMVLKDSLTTREREKLLDTIVCQLTEPEKTPFLEGYKSA